MSFKKIIVATIIGVMTLAGSQAYAGKLRIGVEGAYPPFSWKEADGTLKGFDIDVAFEWRDPRMKKSA